MGSSCCARWEGATPWKFCYSNHRQERGGNCSQLLQKRGDIVAHSLQLLALPIEGGCRTRKLHSPHFLVAFNEGREHKWTPACTSATVPVPCGSGRLRASSTCWVHGASKPAATPRGKANTSCAASGVGCQGSGLAISYSLHKKYSMKKWHGYSWAPNKRLLKTHKHASLTVGFWNRVNELHWTISAIATHLGTHFFANSCPPWDT